MRTLAQWFMSLSWRCAQSKESEEKATHDDQKCHTGYTGYTGYTVRGSQKREKGITNISSTRKGKENVDKKQRRALNGTSCDLSIGSYASPLGRRTRLAENTPEAP
jgi:hypothetical protein